MKHILAVLIAAFTFLILGQASAATFSPKEKALDSFSSPLICTSEEEEKKKKKKKGDEEEPECD